ncbi:MAG: hypothetical protein CMI04_00370 [Oceanospirillaceae bacterium]|jgi:hypothetical protein|nr:hypothetical protein [Oceanospirillaceae bacterium]|tara:strand:+ start:13290 stop:13724 length:435 start_codon:yes stop_codon:yes gene_type:complete
MSSPLNINLIIPFKDNKAGRLNLYRKEIEVFKEMLGQRVEELKEELVSLFGENFELTLAARSDGNSRKYYWRFKSSKRDRKYNRLHAGSIVEYLRVFDDERKLRLKETEEELIYINANLKLIKGMLDSIDQAVDEKAELRSAII